jgi:hypothetical protein
MNSTDTLNQYFAIFTNNHTGRVHSTFCLGETFELAEKAWDVRYGEFNTLSELTLMGEWNTHAANMNARRAFRAFKLRRGSH